MSPISPTLFSVRLSDRTPAGSPGSPGEVGSAVTVRITRSSPPSPHKFGSNSMRQWRVGADDAIQSEAAQAMPRAHSESAHSARQLKLLPSPRLASDLLRDPTRARRQSRGGMGPPPCDDEAYASCLAAAGFAGWAIAEVAAVCRAFGGADGPNWTSLFLGFCYTPAMVAQVARSPSALARLIGLIPVLHALGCPAAIGVALACRHDHGEGLYAAAELLGYSAIAGQAPQAFAQFLYGLSRRRLNWLRRELPVRTRAGEPWAATLVAMREAFAAGGPRSATALAVVTIPAGHS